MPSNNLNKIKRNLKELKILIENLCKKDFLIINEISSLIAKTLKSGGCIFRCENRGSESQSQNLAAELIGSFKNEKFPYRSLSLTSDSTVITSISNDFGYENLFSRQLKALGNKGDLLEVLSFSGNIINFKNAIKTAKSKSIKSISLLKKKGGLIKDYADYSLIINSDITARIQELHNLISNIIRVIGKNELNEK